ncbi:DNA helicase RecQ [Candidatus Parcubacteria bacterium]|nr:DNA helicase RecQ [Candidatus Parcubacteria bacterium]
MTQASVLLKTYFGYDRFRPLQREIVAHVLAGNDALVLMPTGGGKSLCYQLPALALPGLTLVVSPLIALMKDQVDALQANGVAAAFVNSSLPAAEIARIQTRAGRGELKLLYVAPERLAAAGFRDFLASANVSLIAIDEAHCISEWGHDFRPDYRNLARLRQDLSGVPVIALTATATPKVGRDIVHQLNLAGGRTFTSSFDRPNLTYSVQPKRRARQRLEALLGRYRGQPAIVYCFSRSDTEKLAAALTAAGFSAAAYHAGLSPQARSAAQERFIRDKVSVIVATIAFGMGIDKPDIRLVVHWDLPKTVEGYYQEMGRAGRDGLPSECVLFYSFGDTVKHSYFINELAAVAERDNARQKLAQMVAYCEGEECRRRFLLRYFGERPGEEGSCGGCDACLAPPPSADATEITQKILSAVLKTGQRFGAGYVCAVLRGARTGQVLERGHDRLSVFGIAPDYSDVVLKQLMRLLVGRGLLGKSPGEYPTLAVSAAGRRFLSQRQSITLPRVQAPETVVRRPRAAGDLAYDQGLFEKLRGLRKRLADEQGVPPFVIFGDKTLMEMAHYLPQTATALRRIFGVGEQKMARLGEAFLTVISAHVAQQGKG